VIRLAVVGLGHWGPNLARNFDRLPDSELAWICDSSPEALSRWAPSFPDARATTDVGDVLADASLEAVVVATPVPTHAELALRVLEAGKHCFVEKPLAQSTGEAEQAAEAAGDRVLMVGHLLEYHPGIERLKELIDSGDLGDIRYVYSNRLNLGVLRASENALWSLGAHDVSVILRLAGEEPLECRAVGESYITEGVEDVVFGYLRFPSGLAAHMHLSWLDPHKERRFTVVGSRRMATFDDMEVERKVTVYDKGFDEDFSSYGEYIARSGDAHSYRVSNEEPLLIECRHFLDCLRTGTEPRSGGRSGLRVVRVLEALQQSLEASSRAATV
jgi:predicted dehydrogenase